jgi:hypothetical protein
MLPLLPLLSIARGHDSRDHTIPGSPEQGVSGGETLGTRMAFILYEFIKLLNVIKCCSKYFYIYILD